MKIQVPHTNEAIKAEQRYFLFCTAAGKLLVASCIVVSGTFMAIIYISKSPVEIISIAGIVAVCSGYVTAIVLLALGYFWVNSGGHVSNFFEDMGSRVYEFIEADRVLVVDDLGAIKSISINDIKISCGAEWIFLVNNSSVYSLPNTLESKKMVTAINSVKACVNE